MVSTIATVPWDPGMQFPLGLQSQAIKGHPLGGSHKNQGTGMCVKPPFQEIVVLWSGAEGEHDVACWL